MLLAEKLESSEDVRDALVGLAESTAAAGRPALMVLGHSGEPAPRRRALGSVASYLVQHAACTLCIVPCSAAEKLRCCAGKADR